MIGIAFRVLESVRETITRLAGQPLEWGAFDVLGEPDLRSPNHANFLHFRLQVVRADNRLGFCHASELVCNDDHIRVFRVAMDTGTS